MPSSVAPVWSEAELEDHLEFLNSNEAAERTTGTSGYAQSAAYVAARMREFRLQPAVGDDFRVVYTTALNYPISGALRAIADADSTLFYPGIDFLPHGRSDSGEVSVRWLVVTEDTTGIASAPNFPFGVVLRQGDADGSFLRAWRDAGAALAIAVQPLAPRFHVDRVMGLVAIQLAPDAANALMPRNWSTLASGSRIELPMRIFALSRSDFQQNAGAINLLSYIAGKHPVSAKELVIVCADLDDISKYAGIETVDFQNFGVGTSALLEVARNLGYVSRRWSLPERSVLLAVWSGSQLGHQGLRHFLANPNWPRNRIATVIYVGLAPEEEPVVRQLLEEYGLSLHVIPSRGSPLFTRRFVLQPDPILRRMAGNSRRSGSPEPAADPYVLPDMDDVIEQAVVQAGELAAAAYERLILESTDARPYFPANEDSLIVPQAADGQ
jgi:hypothetical protein